LSPKAAISFYGGKRKSRTFSGQPATPSAAAIVIFEPTPPAVTKIANEKNLLKNLLPKI
jgi:hypothetical protein